MKTAPRNMHAPGKVLTEDSFNNVLCRERKRAERSGKSMLLVLLDLTNVTEVADKETIHTLLSGPLSGDIRETDACGWLKFDDSFGIIFTGLQEDEIEQSRQTVELKVKMSLAMNLDPAVIQKITILVHVFPSKKGDSGELEWNEPFCSLFYPEILQKDRISRIESYASRIIDITGSIAALILFSPVFLILPVLIKLTSPGPVFYRQQRLGQFAKPFTFLKFRSMHINNDDTIHREYIKNFISNKVQDKSNTAGGEVVFKIQNDPRLTPIGSFLRKTSLDEFPQFMNVLKGDMSLVGPRPPIPYEVKDYGLWHWYRVLARKPGITGLWQVKGRSLTTFDGMVRQDLQYIRTWSVWLDIKLLLATPLAVLRGKGAC